MRKGGGKLKGSSFERWVATKLSIWASEKKDSCIFWRTASSGGRATQLAKHGHKDPWQCGDINCIRKLGEDLIRNFCIELKFYKDLRIENFIYGSDATKTAVYFWKKLKEHVNEHCYKMPMLICKQNKKKILVVVDKSTFDKIIDYWGYPVNYMYSPKFDAVIFEFDWLVTVGDYKSVKFFRPIQVEDDK